MFVKSNKDVDIWMEIPIQKARRIYLLFRFNLLNFIPIFWNVLIWLNYDLMHLSLCTIFPCTLTYNLWDHCADTGSWIRGRIRISFLRANNQHRPLAIIGHAKTSILQQNMWLKNVLEPIYNPQKLTIGR